MLRSLVVYLFLLLAFRLLGKRQVRQLTPFDLVVLLIISNFVQNAIIGPDNSLVGGLIGAAVIFLANYLVVEITFRSRRARRLLEAQPTLLVHNGRILHDNLAIRTNSIPQWLTVAPTSGRLGAGESIQLTATLDARAGKDTPHMRKDGTKYPPPDDDDNRY